MRVISHSGNCSPPSIMLCRLSRGGLDRDDDWVTTSMVLNAAKANFALEELRLQRPGDVNRWDGLTRWFLRQTNLMPELRFNIYLRRWRVAAEAVSGRGSS
jgi:hypothetical protein